MTLAAGSAIVKPAIERRRTISDNAPAPTKKAKLDEKAKQDILTACERMRAAIRTTVDARDQVKFLTAVDQIASQVAKGEIDMDSLSGHLQQTKGSTRRHLRAQPVTMVQVLNALDGIEQEIIDFFNSLTKK